MSESRDEATGQFSSSEPLVGRAGIEHAMGYVQMPEDKEQPEELTVQDAAERVTESRTAEADIVTHVAGVDMPDNMTMTLEQGAKSVADAREADEAQAEQDEIDQIRKEVDDLRGEEAKQAKEAKPEAPSSPEADVEKFLAIPHVKDAVEKQIREVEGARQAYSQGVDIANQFAQAAFAENFPEIAALPVEHWQGALTAMAQHEPARFQKAMGTLQRVAQLQAAQQHQQQLKAQQERVEFQNYAKAEDARFAELTKDIKPQEMRAIEGEIPSMLAEYGADARQFLEAISGQTKFPRAAAERLLVDAAKYRMLMRAPKAVAARAPLPQVQRPGIARSAGAARADSLEALNAKFSHSGSEKDAVALLLARRSASSR
jgi:hypothetical protein